MNLRIPDDLSPSFAQSFATPAPTEPCPRPEPPQLLRGKPQPPLHRARFVAKALPAVLCLRTGDAPSEEGVHFVAYFAKTKAGLGFRVDMGRYAAVVLEQVGRWAVPAGRKT